MSENVIQQKLFDAKKIREDFPIFRNNRDLVFIDNASTTQKPQSVIDTLSHYYENYNSNIHRGIYQIAEQATAAYEKTRDEVAEFIGTNDRRSIVFTKGATEVLIWLPIAGEGSTSNQMMKYSLRKWNTTAILFHGNLSVIALVRI